MIIEYLGNKDLLNGDYCYGCHLANEAGEYRGYKIRVELRTPDDEAGSEAK